MKSDQYLTLCIEQAELSSLNHRHGCIIVKGGKVIGKGFNDYRPGFDGGALKTGQLPNKTDKQKVKSMRKGKTSPKSFETTVGFLANGHHHTSHSLTMHSEMMAINSALMSSSTKAATALSRFKPTTTATHDSKQRRQQRREALRAYASRICYDAVVGQALQQHVQRDTGSPSPAESRFRAATYRLEASERPQTSESESESEGIRDLSQGKHSFRDTKVGKTGEVAVVSLSSKAQSRRYSSSPEGSLSRMPNHSFDDGMDELFSDKENVNNVNNGKNNPCKNHAEKKPKNRNSPALGLGRHALSDRKKHPKLRGADVYVVRIGRLDKSAKLHSPNDLGPRTGNSSPAPVKAVSTGSLHDELTCKEPKEAARKGSQSNCALDYDTTILESRPCYRCVLYMQSAGIRRCHWTNSDGKWESAKVRDLFDAINSNSEDVFVTKHEVLMFRRLYGMEPST
ncbi:hypothetical protein F5Y16DRAFT_422211 [Xylariaceae sp. FL0255]|nr:hypothetical protein F5Y16DRAFT_422211 [Xylariaceae sp. FL0255]